MWQVWFSTHIVVIHYERYYKNSKKCQKKTKSISQTKNWEKSQSYKMNISKLKCKKLKEKTVSLREAKKPRL